MRVPRSTWTHVLAKGLVSLNTPPLEGARATATISKKLTDRARAQVFEVVPWSQDRQRLADEIVMLDESGRDASQEKSEKADCRSLELSEHVSSSSSAFPETRQKRLLFTLSMLFFAYRVGFHIADSRD